MLRAEDGQGTSIAVGEGVGRDIVVGIVGAILIAGLGMLVGAVLAIVTGVRLVRHRRRSRLAAGPPAPWQQPPVWYPPPPWATRP